MSKRLLLICLGALVIAAAIAFVVYQQRIPAPAVGATAGHDGHAAQPEAEQTPRSDVELDTRRQQLIGVRTVRVQRSAMAPEIRAAGSVVYDETLQAEVNTKVDGWIRELYADYTGRPVRRGDPLFTL